MSGLYDRLKKVYSIYPLDKVQDQNEYRKLEEKYGDNPCFEKFSTRVEKIKFRIERLVGNHDNPKDQIREALFLIKDEINLKDRNDYKDIITMTYQAFWSEQENNIFDKKYKFLINAKNDYFLSFTKRNSSTKYENYINQNHRNFIIDILGEDGYKKSDKNNENLLAESIHKILEDSTLRGFYYPNHEQNNVAVKEKLMNACIKTKSFIQLMQIQMFDEKFSKSRNPNKIENFCFFEYENAIQNLNPEQIIIISANTREEIDKLSINYKYKEWKKRILSQDVIEIPYTLEHDSDKLNKIRNTLKTKLCWKINKIFEDILISELN